MSGGRVVGITGPAAAGKSTVAKALQAELVRDGELWLVVELDTFGRSLPREWISLGEREGRHADLGFIYSRGDDGGIELRLGADARRVLHAFHGAVAAMAKSDVNVICETILYDDADWADWLDALGDTRMCWVKLSAPLATLESREKADRNAAFLGLAKGMSARPSVGDFNILADTEAEEIGAIVERIALTVRNRPFWSAS
jgi:chloramphenicol 3-O-phosphotransferase